MKRVSGVVMASCVRQPARVVAPFAATRPGVDAKTLLEKLQGPGAESLAALIVDDLLAQPVGALVPQALAVKVTRAALSGWLASDDALRVLGRVVEETANRLQARPVQLRDVVSKDLRAALKDVVGRPFSPDRRLVLTVIDREPTRELVRALLLDAVLDFGKKASAPVAGVAKGLGTLARLAGETVKAKSGGLGSLVGAVGSEVERQLEKRAVEFVDAALGGVFGQIADAISDPRRATEAAELRLAFVDGALELTLPQLARELINLDVPGGAEVLRAGLKRWLASAESDEQLAEVAAFVLARDAQRPLKDVLAEVGLLEVVRHTATEQVALHVRRIGGSSALATWLAEA